MSKEEAKQYVDVVIEALVEKGHITEHAYGIMPESVRDELAELVKAKSAWEGRS